MFPLNSVADWVAFMTMEDDRTIASVPDWLMPWALIEPPYDIPRVRTPLEKARFNFFMDEATPDAPWKGVPWQSFHEMWVEEQERIEAAAAAASIARGTEWADLYFIGAEDGPIKIGVAQNVANRLKQLQSAYPYRLIVLARVEGGCRDEPVYHERFAEHRLMGEWFERHPDILAEIERLRAAA